MCFVGVLGLFFIQKALKKHPEYNTELVRELEKAEYYASLNENELKDAKTQEVRKNAKNMLKKMLLIGTGEKVDAYKIVRLFTVLALLFALKGILL